LRWRCAHQPLAGPLLDLSRTNVIWGRVAVGVDFVQPVFVSNVGDAALTLTGLPIAGKDAADCRVGGTCAVSSTLSPGDRCRIDITANFAGRAGGSSATLTVQSDSAAAPNVVNLSGTPAPDIVHGLTATPPWIDFDHQAVAVAAPAQTIALTNPEQTRTLFFDGIALVGPAAADFTMTSDCVVGRQYVNNTGCSAAIGFVPSANGPRSAELEFRAHPPWQASGFVSVRYPVTGVGGAAVPVNVVEY
jgi:hypothetical protein